MKEEKKKKMSGMTGKKLRSAVVMALVCALMLSGATYAWFTLSNTAKVNNLSLKVTSEGNLLVGLDSNDLRSELSLSDNGVLYPCTTNEDGGTMLKPVYETSNSVKEAVDISGGDDEKKSYYYEKMIYLKVEEPGTDAASSNSYAITLGKCSSASDTEGTYVHRKDNTNSHHPEYCVRVSFTTGSGNNAKTVVYEPNCNGQDRTGSKATQSYSTHMTYITHRQNIDGNFEGETGAYYPGDSAELFQIKGNTITPVTVRVWFEGTDEDCTNDIQEAEILSQLKFVSHKVTTSSN